MATLPFSSLLRSTEQGDEYYILPGSAYEAPDYLQAKQKYDALLKEATSKYSQPTLGAAIKYLGQPGSASTPLNPYGYMDYTKSSGPNPVGVWTENKDAPTLRSYAEQLKAFDPIPYLTRQAVATGKAEYDRLQQLTPWGYTAPKPVAPVIVDDSNKSYQDILNRIETQPAPKQQEPAPQPQGYDYTFDMMRADYEKENPGGNFDAYIEEELGKLSGADYDEALKFMGRTPIKTQTETQNTSSDYLKNFEDQLLEQSKAIGAAATQQSQTSKNLKGFHEIMGSLDPQTFAAYTAGLIAPPYGVQEPPRVRDLSAEQNKALQEYYTQNQGSSNPVPIPDWLYPGKEYLKPAPGFEERVPANEFLENYKEEVANLPAGPKGYEPPSESAPGRFIPIQSPGSSWRPGEGFEMIDPFKSSPVTQPGLSQTEKKATEEIAHLTAPFQGPSDPLNRRYDPHMKEWVPNVDPGRILREQLDRAAPLLPKASAEDSKFESAIATASKASDIQKAQGAFGSEYDPQKARAAAQAADEYRRSAKTEDPFRSAAANADPFRSSAFG